MFVLVALEGTLLPTLCANYESEAALYLLTTDNVNIIR